MTLYKINRIALCVAALLVLPTIASAQNSSFVVPFAQTFTNPCTNEIVDVSGSSTVTISERLMNDGSTSTAVSVTTKGTGRGQSSGVSYVFSENQNFTVKAVVIGEAFDSTFSDKLALRGAQSVDNWVVRAYFRLKIDATGRIMVSIERMTGDICKG